MCPPVPIVLKPPYPVSSKKVARWLANYWPYFRANTDISLEVRTECNFTFSRGFSQKEILIPYLEGNSHGRSIYGIEYTIFGKMIPLHWRHFKFQIKTNYRRHVTFHLNRTLLTKDSRNSSSVHEKHIRKPVRRPNHIIVRHSLTNF